MRYFKHPSSQKGEIKNYPAIPRLDLTFQGVSFTFTQQASLTASYRGAVAQLGERLNGIQEVVGSIPIGSTKFLRSKNLVPRA